jgi:hypothetical protein
MMLVHKRTSLAELDKRKCPLLGGCLPTSNCGGPGLVPGNQCRIYVAQCETGVDSFFEYFCFSCRYNFTNAPYCH